jgi:hypothetical protein
MPMRSIGALRAVIALLIVLAGAAVAIALVQGGGGSKAVRGGDPISLLEDNAVLSRPSPTLQALRSLGVGAVRVDVGWSNIAPDPSSPKRPTRFDATNPADYPGTAWATYDTVVKDAVADGVGVDFLLTGPAPLWATGPNRQPVQGAAGAWQPSARAFGQFVHAFATRYSGSYVPRHASAPLPRVHFWEIWNEPNWGPSLQPQLALHPLRVASATAYRGLADAAWSALQRTGHGHDRIVIGNLSPRGVSVPPDTKLAAAVAVSGPLAFTRTLYCVDSHDDPLRGAAALRAGCPTTPDGSNRFALAHPALFEASGFGVHPYPIGLPPTETTPSDLDAVQFGDIPKFASMLDHLQRLYGSHRQLPIYNNEFGYVTNPPNPGTEYASPTRASRYMNWAEYLTWRDPRIGTTMQFLLRDPNPAPDTFGPGGFASGLIFYDGQPKATFYAYRMPIFLPVTSGHPGDALEVWGCARPAHYAYLDTHQAQRVQIQFRAGSSGSFRTVRTVRLPAARSCYFDVHTSFPATGTVRLAWSYPRRDRRIVDPVAPGQTTIYSRDVDITLR